MKINGMIYRGYEIVRDGNGYSIQRDGKSAYRNGKAIRIHTTRDMLRMIDTGLIKNCEWR